MFLIRAKKKKKDADFQASVGAKHSDHIQEAVILAEVAADSVTDISVTLVSLSKQC